MAWTTGSLHSLLSIYFVSTYCFLELPYVKLILLIYTFHTNKCLFTFNKYRNLSLTLTTVLVLPKPNHIQEKVCLSSTPSPDNSATDNKCSTSFNHAKRKKVPRYAIQPVIALPPQCKEESRFHDIICCGLVWLNKPEARKHKQYNTIKTKLHILTPQAANVVHKRASCLQIYPCHPFLPFNTKYKNSSVCVLLSQLWNKSQAFKQAVSVIYRYNLISFCQEAITIKPIHLNYKCLTN